jgi:hypothetical protein
MEEDDPAIWPMTAIPITLPLYIESLPPLSLQSALQQSSGQGEGSVSESAPLYRSH